MGKVTFQKSTYRNEETGQGVKSKTTKASHYNGRQILFGVDDGEPQTEEIAKN